MMSAAKAVSPKNAHKKGGSPKKARNAQKPILRTMSTLKSCFFDLSKQEGGFLKASRNASQQLAVGIFEAQPVSSEQIALLGSRGNTSSDWGDVRILGDFDLNRIERCRFEGSCILMATGDTPPSYVSMSGVDVRWEVRNCTFRDCAIEHGSLIFEVTVMRDTYVRRGAVVSQCALVVGYDNGMSGNGQTFSLGCEVDREVMVIADGVVEDYVHILEDRLYFLDECKKYLAHIQTRYSVIEEGAQVFRCARIEDFFIGKGVKIESSLIEHATVMGPDTFVSNSKVLKSALQSKCRVESFGVVENSVMCSNSQVANHGTLSCSVIGSGSSVMKGEVTACLMGPMIGFHHQALLIAATWPAGKGNIGFGASIGSNHTGKAPDQECVIGEGVFFGLGTAAKYPLNMLHAPHSLVASRVTMLPQKFCFPFSLINTPMRFYDSVPPAFNEVIPGWVLRVSMFTVVRNEMKYRERAPAGYESRVITDDIAMMMYNAREALRKVDMLQESPIVTEKELWGLGKNFVLRNNIPLGIEIYTRFLKIFALDGLFSCIKAGIVSTKNDPKIWANKKAPFKTLQLGRTGREQALDWEFIRSILVDVYPEQIDLSIMLDTLVSEREKIIKEAIASKGRDDFRGATVIDGYDSAHLPAAENKAMKKAEAALEKLKEEIVQFCSKNSMGINK